MPSAARSRASAQAWLAAAAGAVLLAILAPVGLASSEAVDLGAVALGARRSFAGAHPLADLLSRLVALVPVGEVGVRAHALAALAGIVALALLAWRQRERNDEVPWHLAGVALLALGRPFLEVATVHPVAAVDLALLVAGVRLIGAVRASDTDARAGLRLAFVCGLAAAAGWPVRVALWPIGALLTARAFRRGQRWASMAPVVFGAATVPLLGAVVGASPPAPTVAQVLARVLVLPPHPATTRGVWTSMALGLGEELGALALLVAAVGAWTLLRRPQPGRMVPGIAWLLAFVAATLVGDRALARVVAAVALVGPVSAGISALAAGFGRARVAVAAVIVVVVVLPAAWVGVRACLAAPAWRVPAQLSRRLDAAGPVTSLPNGHAPASAGMRDMEEMQRWLRYRGVVGPPLEPPRILPQ